MKGRKKAHSLSELAKRDYMARVSKLCDLGEKKMVEYRVVNGRVEGVKLDDLLANAQQRKLDIYQDNDRLVLGKVQHIS